MAVHLKMFGRLGMLEGGRGGECIRGGVYQRGIVLGDGFELLPHLLAAVSQFIEKSISKH